jgi:hypothetical protein
MSLIDNVKQLEAKQKFMLVALIGALGVVFYLIYTTFFATSAGSNTSVPTVAPVTQQAATPAQTPIQPASAPVTTAPAIANTTNTVTVGQPAPPTPQDLALLAESQQMQQQYVQLVNQYQLAQLQQKLAQVDAEIANNKLTTAKSLVEMKKLQPQLGGDYNTSLSNSAASSNNGPQTYQTLYVGQVSGRWQAMLQAGGQYFQVSVGMQLPDGSSVSSISSRGVVLNRNGTPIFLPMSKSLD